MFTNYFHPLTLNYEKKPLQVSHYKTVTYTGSQSLGAIPRRMNYSTTEKQINAANYDKAVAGLPGGDKITSRIWWDIQ